MEDDYLEILKDELNVKSVELKSGEEKLSVQLDLKVTPVLKREGMVREVIRNVQSGRKAAGLNVDDRIELSLSTTSDELRRAIEEHIDTVKAETLADTLSFDRTFSYEASCAVDDLPLTVSLQKL